VSTIESSGGAATTPGVDPSAKVHPAAFVDESAAVGPSVVIERGAHVGPHCVVGEGSRLRPGAMLVEHTTLGCRNDVHPYAVLGGDPQDRAFSPESPGALIVGDDNVFREGVTLSRGTHPHPDTRIGSRNMFMAQAHAGHNAQLGDDNVLGNGVALAGHAHVGDRCVLSAFAVVHQFTTVGNGCMFQGRAGVGMHVPPYCIAAGVNHVAGVNTVGLRRMPGATPEDRVDVRELFRRLIRGRDGAALQDTLDAVRSERDWSPAGVRFLAFIDEMLNHPDPKRRRGICGWRGRSEL
jgi:UDP-N-acetylglucosamine acyltransferase